MGAVLSLAITGAPAVAGAGLPQVPEAPFLVAVDAGHGGTASSDPEQLFDPGVSGFGLEEKDITLELAQRMQARFRAERVPVLLTRTRDEFVTSAERMRRAQVAHADAFISVHINSDASDSTAGGSLVLYPNAASSPLAETVRGQLRAALAPWQLDDRGAILKPDLWAKLEMPTVTVEPAFLSNAQEAELLKSAPFKEAIAGAVVQGLLAAFPDLPRARTAAELETQGLVLRAPPPALPSRRPAPAPARGRDLRAAWPAVLFVMGVLLASGLRRHAHRRRSLARAGPRPPRASTIRGTAVSRSFKSRK